MHSIRFPFGVLRVPNSLAAGHPFLILGCLIAFWELPASQQAKLGTMIGGPSVAVIVPQSLGHWAGLLSPISTTGQRWQDEESQPPQPKQDKPDSLSPRERAALLRRPTTPTDAKELADRPTKPEFIRSDKSTEKDKYDLTFDDLAFEIPAGKNFDWSMLTDEIQQYDGKRITLRGYIKPSFSQKNIKQFVFVRDNQECCFGPGAALFDCVLVKLAEGKGTNYTVRPVTIEGEFYLRKYAGPDGNIWAIYRMKEGEVK